MKRYYPYDLPWAEEINRPLDIEQKPVRFALYRLRRSIHRFFDRIADKIVRFEIRLQELDLIAIEHELGYFAKVLLLIAAAYTLFLVVSLVCYLTWSHTGQNLVGR